MTLSKHTEVKSKTPWKVTHKGCAWYKGKDSVPDLTKCKECLYCTDCLGRIYMKWQKIKGNPAYLTEEK